MLPFVSPMAIYGLGRSGFWECGVVLLVVPGVDVLLLYKDSVAVLVVCLR